jgi:uncharacterized protein YhjY with autotransporter beta-barrel domain
MTTTILTRARAAGLLLSASIFAMAQSASVAAPITVTSNPPSATNLSAPNTTGGVGAVTFQGATFVNQGQVGAGRFTATGRDFNNDTLGSFSGMTFQRATWRRNASTGQYTGGMYTLPDRGPNFSLTGFPGNFFSNYNGRLNSWTFSLTPYSGPALPQSTASQSQLTLTPAGGFLFSDFNGQAFTGLEPGSNTLTQNGFLFGGPATGLGAGKISLDAEAIATAPDGTFYVSDEYQVGIFHLSATGRLIGYIPATSALTPRVGGVVNFTTADAVAGQTGRRLNQGLEGLTITPDGKTLWVMLQSATLQDSTLGNDALRTTTRLIGYDISTNATPSNSIAEYVMELPVFNRGNTNGTITAGQASNRTAAQSEILALNSTQFLVLSRDGNGVGNDPTAAGGNDGRPPVFKSVMLIDTAGATNINDTARQDTPGGRVTTAAGIIDPAITPVRQVQLVNIINQTELNRFGVNLATGAGTNPTTISEKWEAMDILPTLEEDKPQDVFLFVGNDNDFQTTNGRIGAGMTNGTDTLTTYNSGFNNDNMYFVYRLTLPTYVDPHFYQAMVRGAPIVASAMGDSATGMSAGAGQSINAQLDSGRRGGASGGSSIWGALNYASIDPLINGEEYTAEVISGTAGIQTEVLPNVMLGAAGSYGSGSADITSGYGFDMTAITASAYVSYTKGAWFAQSALTFGWSDFEDITRPAAFGLIAKADTSGTSTAISVKTGYVPNWGGLNLGPVLALQSNKIRIDGYAETGAAGGNLTFAAQSSTSHTFSLGLEGHLALWDGIRAVGGLMYNAESGGDRDLLVKLTSSSAAIASQFVNVPSLTDDYMSFSLGLQSDGDTMFAWRAGYELQMGVDRTEDITHQVSAGASVRF